MDKLGEKIKELRTENNLTQPQLAKLIGVSKGMISIWENDINEPKATYIAKLALVLNTSTDYLLGIEDENGIKIQQYSNNHINVKGKNINVQFGQNKK